MMRTVIIAVSVGLLLAGCAQVPKPATYKLSYQRKMQAAHHWDLLAQDVAERVATCQDPQNAGGVFVQPATGVFGATLTSLVKTELVNRGVSLATAPAGAATLDIEVQLVQYRAKWPHRANRTQPGFWTAISTGIRMAASTTVNMIIPGGVVLDLLAGSNTTLTRHEVVVTTSLQKDGRYVMRQANIYYVNDADRGQYAQCIPGSPKTLEAVAQ